MAATPSNMMPLGTIAPDFALFDTITRTTQPLNLLKGSRGTVIMFICNHCPYVMHVKDQLIALAKEYTPLGISFIAISSNDVANYPEDAPDKMGDLMDAWGKPFAAYLYDETQNVARDYQAACTPDIYLFDANLACVYRGRLDAATPKNEEPVTGADLRLALDSVLNGTTLEVEQFPSIGCNIKWKAE